MILILFYNCNNKQILNQNKLESFYLTKNHDFAIKFKKKYLVKGVNN